MFFTISGASDKIPPANEGNIRNICLIPGLGRSWERKWQPTLIFSLGQSLGQRGLAGYNP